MGFESFRIELRGEKVTYPEAAETIRQLPFAKRDHESLPMPGSTYYLIDDGRHVIEVELKDAPVRLSCRFTLCHPPSVDSAFLSLARDLMSRLGMQADICDDVRPEHAHPFSLGEIAEFSAAVSQYIAARRAEWVVNFGTETLAATTSVAFQRIILPRCQPGVGQAT
jgi:hypothetical protein